MELVQSIKRLVPGSTDDETYKYQCTACYTNFESSEEHMGKIECPECGDRNVQSLLQ